MAGIVLSQPGGVGTIDASSGAPTNSRIVPDVRCYLSFVGTTTSWSFSISGGVPLHTTTPDSTRFPSFSITTPGTYLIQFTDSSATVYSLTIYVPAMVSSNPVFDVDNVAAARNISVNKLSPGQTVVTRSRSSTGDNGGAIYTWVQTSTAPDNGGSVLQLTGVGTGRLIANDTSFVDIRRFGAVQDLVSHTTGAILAGQTTLTDPNGTFTQADVAKVMIMPGPTPGTQATGTIAVTASNTTIVGTGTSFTTELAVGDVVGYMDNSNTYFFTVRVASITDNLHFVTDTDPPHNNLSGITLWKTATWKTTISSVQSATQVTLSQAAAVRLDSTVWPLFRYTYATNNLSAIQAAQDAGGKVEFPPGTYAISGTINPGTNSVFWRGSGWMRRHYDIYASSTNLRTDCIEGACIFQMDPSSSVLRVDDGSNFLKVQVHDLAFRGPGSGAATAVDFSGGLTKYCEFFHCLAFNFATGWDHQLLLESTFHKLEAFACKVGLKLSGANPPTATTYIDLDVQVCGEGIRVDRCTGVKILDGTYQACSTAISMQVTGFPGGVEGVLFQGGWAETYSKALDISLNGIFHNVHFADFRFSGGVTFQPVNNGKGTIDGITFSDCVADLKVVDAANVEFDKVRIIGTRMGTPALTINNPTNWYGLFSEGSLASGLLYSFAGAALDKGAPTQITGAYTPAWTDGMFRCYDVTGNTTVSLPTNAPRASWWIAMFHKTGAFSVTMSGFKGTFNDTGGSGTYSIVHYFFDGASWWLDHQSAWMS